MLVKRQKDTDSAFFFRQLKLFVLVIIGAIWFVVNDSVHIRCLLWIGFVARRRSYLPSTKYVNFYILTFKCTSNVSATLTNIKYNTIVYRPKQVKPAAIVDTIVEAVVDILVPGRGAGESNW